MSLYICTVAEARTEGISTIAASDAMLESRLLNAQKVIEDMTGNWFYAKTFSSTYPYQVFGNGLTLLETDHPIISISKITLRSGTSSTSYSGTELTDRFRIYANCGQGYPDDRKDPKIYYLSGTWPVLDLEPSVLIEGVFGYCDVDVSGDTTTYVVPDQIKRVAISLAARDLAALGNQSQRLDDMRSRYATEGRLDVYTFKMGEGAVSGAGSWGTGDIELDKILMEYKRQVRIT